MEIKKEEQHWEYTPSVSDLLAPQWTNWADGAPGYSVLDLDGFTTEEIESGKGGIIEWFEFTQELGGVGVVVSGLETQLRATLFDADESQLIVMPTLQEAVDAVFFAIIENSLGADDLD